jgi:hypothetical protein
MVGIIENLTNRNDMGMVCTILATGMDQNG